MLPICRLITFDASNADVVVGCVESVVFVRQIDADRGIALVSTKRMFVAFLNIFFAYQFNELENQRTFIKQFSLRYGY